MATEGAKVGFSSDKNINSVGESTVTLEASISMVCDSGHANTSRMLRGLEETATDNDNIFNGELSTVGFNNAMTPSTDGMDWTTNKIFMWVPFKGSGSGPFKCVLNPNVAILLSSAAEAVEAAAHAHGRRLGCVLCD